MSMNINMKHFAAICLVALSGCASQVLQQSTDSLQTIKSIETAQRALPTQTGNVKQPAHYQHVYIDSSDPNSGSIQTISLADAVESNVLASSPLQAKPLDKVDPKGLRWMVMDRDFARPSEIEGVGGADVAAKLFSVVNFDVNKTEILNREKLDELLQLASRVSGMFYVVGYADETGIEAKNVTLSKERAQAVADALMAGGVNSTRVHVSGAGVSRIYPTLRENRHTSVSFRVLE